MTPFLNGLLAAATLLAASGQSGAVSSSTAPSTGLIHAPTVVQYLNAYPKAALASKQNGKVSLHCAVELDGTLSHCTAVEEAPAGKGFGAASLTLAPSFKLGPGPFQPGDVIDVPLTWTPTGFAPAMPDSTRPRLVSKPAPKDYLAFYPAKARSEKINGEVVIHCRVDRVGAISGCAVFDEYPTGYGFGDAAMKMTSLFRVDVGSGSDATDVTLSLAWNLAALSSGEMGVAVDVQGQAITVAPELQWISKPSSKDLYLAYPERARLMGKHGHATMQCTVKNDGFLVNCKVLSESPAGYRFGDALLKLAPHYQLAPPDNTTDAPERGTVTIPADFYEN